MGHRDMRWWAVSLAALAWTATVLAQSEPSPAGDAAAQAPPSAAPPAQADGSASRSGATVPTIPVPEPRPEPIAPPPEPAARLEEVVVTAQKRVQRLVDVPINVSAMSQREVRETRVEQVRDVAAYIPNLDIKEQVPGGIPVVSIRGVGLDDFSSTNSPAAGIYVDQVTLSSLALMSFDLYDIERIEVLKGPQGTLYGRNSTAGAINVISAKPSYTREARLSAGYGNYRTANLEGMLNLPLGDVVAVRLAAKYIRQDEGYWRSRQPGGPSGGTTVGGLPALPIPPVGAGRDTSNDPVVRTIGKRSILLGRTQLRWDATSDLRFDLKLEGERSRSEMGQPEFFGSLCQPGFAPIDPQHCTDALGYSDRDGNPYKGDWRGDFPYTIDQLGETLIADYNFGGATLTSVSGYIGMRRFFHIDVDGTPADEFNFLQGDRVRQFTQELRLAGTGEWVDWLGGLFWSKDDVSVRTLGNHQDLIPLEHSHITADQDTRSAAAFLNGDWHLARRLTLVTGVRYTYEKRAYVGGTTWDVPVPGQVANTFQDSAIRDRNWSWKLGLNFAPTRRSLIYANASKGIKSGGYFSGVTTDNAQLAPYKPEHLTAYEIGAKTQGRLAFNASAFYYDYKDVQTFMRSNSVPVQFIGNVSQATSYGLDLESILRAGGLTLRGGVGLLHTRLGEFVGPSGSTVPAGNRLANAPPVTFSALARYEFPLFSTGTLIGVQGDTHYSAKVYKEATNDPLIAAAPYWIFDARVSLISAQRNWEFALWGRNLTDKLYVSQGLDIGAFFFGNHNYNAPRTFGGEFSVSF